MTAVSQHQRDEPWPVASATGQRALTPIEVQPPEVDGEPRLFTAVFNAKNDNNDKQQFFQKSLHEPFASAKSNETKSNPIALDRNNKSAQPSVPCVPFVPLHGNPAPVPAQSETVDSQKAQ